MWKIGKEEKSCVCSQGPVLLWKKCRFCLLSVTNMMNEKQTREQRQDSHVLVTHLSFSYMHTISSSRDGLPLAFIRFLFMLINQNHGFCLVNIFLLKIILQNALKGSLEGSWWERRLLDNCRFVCFFKLFQDFQGFIAGGVSKGWNKGSVLHSVEGGERAWDFQRLCCLFSETRDNDFSDVTLACEDQSNSFFFGEGGEV